jgi:hypothetical protein
MEKFGRILGFCGELEVKKYIFEIKCNNLQTKRFEVLELVDT